MYILKRLDINFVGKSGFFWRWLVYRLKKKCIIVCVYYIFYEIKKVCVKFWGFKRYSNIVRGLLRGDVGGVSRGYWFSRLFY